MRGEIGVRLNDRISARDYTLKLGLSERMDRFSTARSVR